MSCSNRGTMDASTLNMDSKYRTDSGYFTELNFPWRGIDTWTSFENSNKTRRLKPTSAPEVTVGARSVDVVMKEFEMNGKDSPYYTREDVLLRIKTRNNDELNGLAQYGYMRQKSWPEPEATPSVPLRRVEDFQVQSFEETMWPANKIEVPKVEPALSLSDLISEEQLRVLNTLPTQVIYHLLREIEKNSFQQDKPAKHSEDSVRMECRFCKNNGESESHYRSHRLRWRGRLICPVLRAYRCRRCGARGDYAHTVKYCPYTTDEEKMLSTAMTRCLHTSKARRGYNSKAPSLDVSGNFKHMMADVPINDAVYNYEPLDPIWEALEKKLML